VTDENTSFIDYWDAIDAAMKKLFGIDTFDASIGAACVSLAQDDGTTPEDFALWFGEKYGLTLMSEWGR